MRCFVGVSPKETSVLDSFVKELLAADTAFPTRNNQVEMQVLCGAAIATVLEQSSAVADSAALMVTSASATGLREPPILPDIVQVAGAYLASRSETLRKIDARRKFTVNKYEPLIEAVKNAAATNQAQQMKDPLESLLKTMGEAINSTAIIAEQASQVLERADAVLSEESNSRFQVAARTIVTCEEGQIAHCVYHSNLKSYPIYWNSLRETTMMPTWHMSNLLSTVKRPGSGCNMFGNTNHISSPKINEHVWIR